MHRPKNCASLIVALFVTVFLPSWTAADDLQSTAELRNLRVAVTFDDLPVVGLVGNSIEKRREIMRSLIRVIAERDVPAIGFVNEGKMYMEDTADEDQVDLLRLWLAAGFDLGNHGYSHLDLHRTSLAEFEADVVRGEHITAQLLAENNRDVTYFRHPFLHTGTELHKKRAFEKFLTTRGYGIAPVSIDNSEWIFARAYDLAVRAGDAQTAKRIGEEYVTYMLKIFAYYEKQSTLILARNIDHILLLHANRLNSHWFGVLADCLSETGYTFISLTEALLDPAYASPDTYIGAGGISWIHRWGLTKGIDRAEFAGEPETAPWILQLTELREHSYTNDDTE